MNAATRNELINVVRAYGDEMMWLGREAVIADDNDKVTARAKASDSAYIRFIELLDKAENEK